MKRKLPFIILLAAFAFSITTAQTTLLTQDFESGLGSWTVVDSTTDSVWRVRTNPFFEPYLGSLTFHSATPTKFALIISDADTGLINTNLISPVINCTGVNHVALKFTQWFKYYGASAPTVSVSNDGTTWTPVYHVVASSGQTNPELVRLDISSVAANQATVYVKFNYPARNDYFWALDDISVYQPADADAALTTVTPIARQAYGLVASNVNLGGTIFNYGSSPITSSVVKWSDGTNVYANALTTNIASFDSLNFTHNHPYTIPALGSHPLTMWVELANDTIYGNDTLSFNITGAPFIPAHKVVIEDQTQCSTGFSIYCPRGIVYKDSFVRSNLSDMAEVISVHSNISGPPNDPMYDTTYSTGSQAIPGFLGWPSITIDRKENGQPENIFNLFNKYAADFGVADVALNVTYDTTSRGLSVVAHAHFAIAATPGTGRYNFALVLTEDSVHGTDTSYAQANQYAGGALGPMAGAGIDFAAQPNPVPAALMYYMNVARKISATFTGSTNSIPISVAADSTVNYTFPEYTVPAGWNVAKTRATVLLINTNTYQIMNANGAPLIAVPTGLSEVSNQPFMFNVYPNPFTDEANIVFNLDKPESVTMGVTNLLGQTITVYRPGTLATGEHTITLSGKYLSPGLYFVTLSDKNGSSTKRVMLNK